MAYFLDVHNSDLRFNFNFKIDSNVHSCLFVGFIFEVEVDVKAKI